jgi:hypothetical protein
LQYVRRSFGRDGQVMSWKEAAAALSRLKNIGGCLLHDLLGHEHARAQELENFLRFVVREWREPLSSDVETWIETSPGTPTELAALPFEILPLFDRALPGSIEDLQSLAYAAVSFLCYATTVVRGRSADVEPEDVFLRRDPATSRVPVAVFEDAQSLPTVRTEIDYIATGTAHFGIVTRWPGKVVPPYPETLLPSNYLQHRNQASWALKSAIFVAITHQD